MKSKRNTVVRRVAGHPGYGETESRGAGFGGILRLLAARDRNAR